MFFTKIGTWIAHIVFWLGTTRVIVAAVLAFGSENMGQNVAASRRYLAASNTGEAINEGMMYMLVGVALGVLCEISKRQKDRLPGSGKG